MADAADTPQAEGGRVPTVSVGVVRVKCRCPNTKESDLMIPTTKTTAPRHLRPATKKWFKTIVGEFASEPHHVKLLVAAAEAWDEHGCHGAQQPAT